MKIRAHEFHQISGDDIEYLNDMKDGFINGEMIESVRWRLRKEAEGPPDTPTSASPIAVASIAA